MKRNRLEDILLMDFCGLIVLAEILHMAILLRGWSFSRCAIWFAVGLAVIAVVSAAFFAWKTYKGKCALKEGADESVKDGSTTGRIDTSAVMKKLRKSRRVEAYLALGVLALMLSQIAFLLFGGQAYLKGDMTVETVGSFLTTDSVYQVNPLTGAPYTTGMPLRLQILGLPGMYGFLCSVTGISPIIMVGTIIPVVVLIFSYLAFGLLGQALFPEERKKQLGFLIAVGLLFWVETSAVSMDGFRLLYAGYQGVTIRNLVLLPWLFSLILRKKWLYAFGLVAVEACMVWTLYGLGMCGLAIAVMFLVRIYPAMKEKYLELSAKRRGQHDGTP